MSEKNANNYSKRAPCCTANHVANWTVFPEEAKFFKILSTRKMYSFGELIKDAFCKNCDFFDFLDEQNRILQTFSKNVKSSKTNIEKYTPKESTMQTCNVTWVICPVACTEVSLHNNVLCEIGQKCNTQLSGSRGICLCTCPKKNRNSKIPNIICKENNTFCKLSIMKTNANV